MPNFEVFELWLVPVKGWTRGVPVKGRRQLLRLHATERRVWSAALIESKPWWRRWFR
jgi:hypothetical protein